MAETAEEREQRLIREGLERGRQMLPGAATSGGPSIEDYGTSQQSERWYVGYEWSPYTSTPRQKVVGSEKAAKEQYYSFDESQNARLNDAASAKAGYRAPRSWNKGMWEEAVMRAKADTQRYGVPVSPWDYIDSLAKAGRDIAEKGKGGKGSKYKGPVASVTLANEDDLRAAADTLGAEILGRAITDDEFQRAFKKIRSAERAQPTVTTSTPGMTVTESGLSAEGRKDIMREVLLQGPEAEDFTLATKMMDLYRKALGEMPNG